jgi:hypothetical protein
MTIIESEVQQSHAQGEQIALKNRTKGRCYDKRQFHTSWQSH